MRQSITECSRRIAWNGTLVIGGIFGVVAGAAPNFAVLGVFVAFIVSLALSMDGREQGRSDDDHGEDLDETAYHVINPRH